MISVYECGDLNTLTRGGDDVCFLTISRQCSNLMVPMSPIFHPRGVHSVSGNPQQYQGRLRAPSLDSEPKSVGNQPKFVAQGHRSEPLLQHAEAVSRSSDNIFEHGQYRKLFPRYILVGNQI